MANSAISFHKIVVLETNFIAGSINSLCDPAHSSYVGHGPALYGSK